MKLAAAAAVAMLAASCPRESSREASPPAAVSGQELRIEEGTQARLDADQMIGAGNFWEENGRLTCGLWFSSPQEATRVHAGQVLERGGRKYEVVDVSNKGGKGVVVLRVTGP